MEQIIEELYKDFIYPNSQDKSSEKRREYTRRVREASDEVYALLGEENQNVFENYNNVKAEEILNANYEAFKEGLKLGLALSKFIADK